MSIMKWWQNGHENECPYCSDKSYHLLCTNVCIIFSVCLNVLIKGKKLFKFLPGAILAPQVAFTASLSQNINGLGIHQTIVFDDVTINVGDSYNRHNGMFVVPVSGYYVVAITVSAVKETFEKYVELVQDGTPLTDLLINNVVQNDDGRPYDGTFIWYQPSTSQWIFHFNKGSNVWLRTTNYKPLVNILGQRHSHISCGLLYAD